MLAKSKTNTAIRAFISRDGGVPRYLFTRNTPWIVLIEHGYCSADILGNSYLSLRIILSLISEYNLHLAPELLKKTF